MAGVESGVDGHQALHETAGSFEHAVLVGDEDGCPSWGGGDRKTASVSRSGRAARRDGFSGIREGRRRRRRLGP